MVKTGLDVIRESPERLKRYGTLGLLYNQASISSGMILAPEVINSIAPGRLKVLFGPQHGVGLTEQDNMIETSHQIHEKFHLPVYSLYESSRRPSKEMLKDVDAALIDIQDVGTRVYTFATTALYLMNACADSGKPVIVLDRPNPVNGRDVQGNVLDPAYTSFVGPYPIPMRHGMTIGELMGYYNGKYELGCDLDVVRMECWERGQYFDETGLVWAMPSPNMPTVETAIVYPGQVLLEGTRLSEGRGTTRPFEIFGAPYFEPERILGNLDTDCLDGAFMREINFRPAFNKFANQTCKGFQLHVTNRDKFRPYSASLAIIASIAMTHTDDFGLFEGPYEYVFDKRPIDVIAGDKTIVDAILSGRRVLELEESWNDGLRQFMQDREEFLLYG
jgi:uncharacterized protein YbbC (DUF1343 family)